MGVGEDRNRIGQVMWGALCVLVRALLSLQERQKLRACLPSKSFPLSSGPVEN